MGTEPWRHDFYHLVQSLFNDFIQVDSLFHSIYTSNVRNLRTQDKLLLVKVTLYLLFNIIYKKVRRI